jgi:hypothetical protein
MQTGANRAKSGSRKTEKEKPGPPREPTHKRKINTAAHPRKVDHAQGSERPMRACEEHVGTAVACRLYSPPLPFLFSILFSLLGPAATFRERSREFFLPKRLIHNRFLPYCFVTFSLFFQMFYFFAFDFHLKSFPKLFFINFF